MQFLDTIESYKCAGGLALEIHTPVEEIENEALDKAKVIILLAIPTGTTGSPFDERVIQKIKDLRKIYSGSILIDGAMKPDTYKIIIEAGANEAGANSGWWEGKFDE